MCIYILCFNIYVCSINVSILCLFSVSTMSAIFANISSIPMLNDSNFKNWKEHVMTVLGCLDLDHVFRLDHPAALTNESTPDQKSAYEKWERSNRVSLGMMKLTIPESIKGSISEENDAKAFLKEVSDRYAINEKVETSTILAKITTMRHNGKGSIREYILEMSNLAARLKALKLEMPEGIVVQLALNSLPIQYDTLKVSYNTQKEKWSLHELLAQCVQEEERLKRGKIESAHLASTSSDPGNKKRKRTTKGKEPAVTGAFGHQEQKKRDSIITCFFCKKNGHLKKDCSKYANWRAKKGMSYNFVSSEVNLALVPSDTWWIDTGATTHISVTMQACHSSRLPIDGERYIYTGNGKKAQVQAIRTFQLMLDSGFILILENTFIVPSFRRNLISVSCLDKSGYLCSFGNETFSLFQNSKVIGTGSLIDKLYKLNMQSPNTNLIMNATIIGSKRKLNNEKSSMLWHKRMGHISKQRIERLITQGILDSLDMSDFGICVDCIKGKMTNKRKTGANRCSNVLELIHTDICGPFPTASWNGHTYFITFIDDYSRYGYLYLIHQKAQALEVFKIFKAEVENQLGKKIKAVKSDCGGEYYGRYDGSGEQRPGPFAKYLSE